MSQIDTTVKENFYDNQKLENTTNNTSDSIETSSATKSQIRNTTLGRPPLPSFGKMMKPFNCIPTMNSAKREMPTSPNNMSNTHDTSIAMMIESTQSPEQNMQSEMNSTIQHSPTVDSNNTTKQLDISMNMPVINDNEAMQMDDGIKHINSTISLDKLEKEIFLLNVLFTKVYSEQISKNQILAVMHNE